MASMDAVIASLSISAVDANTVKRANFSKFNDFSPGDIVITPCLNGKFYFYSYIVSNYTCSPPGGKKMLMFEVCRHFPFRNYTCSFTAGAIGLL